MMPTETMVDTPKQKSSLLRTVKAVAWSFIGLRKGSDFTAKLNETLQALADDGTVAKLAEKYPNVMVTL